MILAVDTTHNHGSIAISRQDELQYSAWFDVKITHSESLMPEIDRALKILSCKPEDITAILLCSGPGSFTGLRIGLATAKGIAYALKVPLLTYNSLQLSAVNLYNCGRDILVVLDAKMSEVYIALYTQDLQEIIPPQTQKPEDLLNIINTDVFITGSAAMIISKLFKQNGKSFQITLGHQGTPYAAALFDLFALYPQVMKYDFKQLAELEPLYLRESTAQLRHRLKGNQTDAGKS